ncbi:MAG: multiheme c-type cytochrome [Planctomycetota bacterium]|nr:multiheme c-type cytochrome [Planctomycetota bacterium]
MNSLLSSFRLAHIASGVVLFACAVFLTNRDEGFAQDAAVAAPPAKPAYKGMRLCAQCHEDRLESQFNRDFCRLNESTIFEKQDRHFQAYELLVNSPLAKQMAARLEIDLKTERSCLNCHADWNPDHGDTRPPTLEMGVNCEACHGPSSLWDNQHQVIDNTWRIRSAKEKSDLGMWDVRDPVRRAEICISCHIGDHGQQRFITHKMYAAGHPQLPAFELATFERRMPPHWRRAQEKGDFQFRDRYINEANRPEFPETRDLLIGGLMSFRATLLLVAGPKDPPRALDFAQFDCQACHHELQSPAWRQVRDFPGQIGRLRANEWSQVLANTAQGVTDLGQEWDDGLKKISAAFERSPFGDPELLRAAVHGKNENVGFSQRLRIAGDGLRRVPLDSETVKRFSDKLVAVALKQPVDYHSARQLAWALVVLDSESAAGVPGGFQALPERDAGAPMDAAAVAARRKVEEHNWNQFVAWCEGIRRNSEEQAQGDLKRVDEILGLELPGTTCALVGKRLPDYGTRMAERLCRSAKYRPVEFRDAVREFQGRRAPNPPKAAGN